MNTQTTTTSIARRHEAAASQMAMIMATAARVAALAALGDERAEKMRALALLKERTAAERTNALSLLEDEIRLALQ